MIDWMRAVELVSVVGAIIAAFWAYYNHYKDKEWAAYHEMDEKYREYLRMCLDLPHLDIFDIPNEKFGVEAKVELTPEQKKAEVIAFTILFSIFERAFLMYRGKSSALRKKQWNGWEDYMKGYCLRNNFIDAWIISGDTFDKTFKSFMDRLVEESRRKKKAEKGVAS